MKIFIIIILLSNFASFLVSAKGQISIGVGYQHASLLGIQYGVLDGTNKYFAAVGLGGAAVGYQRGIDSQNKHALGVVFGKESLTSEDGFALLTYNYHLSNIENSGLQLGISAGVRREDDFGFFGDSGETSSKFVVAVDISYKF